MTGDPAERAELLDREAEAAAMAEVRIPAFGPDPNPYEDGRDVTESLTSGAITTFGCMHSNPSGLSWRS